MNHYTSTYVYTYRFIWTTVSWYCSSHQYSVSSIISSLLTILIVYLCCMKPKGNYSVNTPVTTGPVYDTSLPVNVTSEFEMKGNQAYGHVTSAPRSTSTE